MKVLSILGSTGSIGTQTLAVCRACPEDYRVATLSCGTRIDDLIRQAREFVPEIVSVQRESDVPTVREGLRGLPTRVVYGEEGLLLCATWPSSNIVVAAMVGVRGLIPVLSAIEAGKDIALANKETLVAGGSIVMNAVRRKGVALLPVDSEHSAIWQCLWGQPEGSLERILLTASGGPFRGFTAEQLNRVTVDDALKHPTWSMGGKITIDSASMMNKGLEVIEASWLFGIPVDQITVVVHPQSIVHSMVRLKDGSVLAQMGRPSMILPIEIALNYPNRGPILAEPFDPFAKDASDLHFEPCDERVFPLLTYAYHAGRVGGSLPAVMNSANEEAVAAFLAGRIPFTGIAESVRLCMEAHEREGILKDVSLEDILRLDTSARHFVREYLSSIS